MFLSGRLWNAGTAVSSCLATALTVAGLTGRPSAGNSAIATLRVEAEQKAGEDHSVYVLGAPGVGADDLERAEGAGARHLQLDHAELGEQPSRVSAVAPVGRAELGHAL
jgi:hypothetical protein